MKARPIVIILLFSILSIAWFNPNADKIKAGNRLYKEGKYGEAMDHYTDVLVELPKSPNVHFNVGASAYKKGDYERAVDAYTKSLSIDYPALEEKGQYSIGNCKYKQGERMESNNASGAIVLYREALESYKRAIDLNSKNMDAKFNYEVVQRKIKEIEDKQQRQNQQNQDSDRQNEEKQDEKKENLQKDEPQDVDSQEEQQQKQERQQGTPEQEDGEQKSSPQSSEANGKMTKAEALRLLDALKDEEQQQLIRRRKRGTSYPENFKDW